MNWWFWFVLGVAFLGLELVTPTGFFLFFFGVSGIILGFIGLLGIQMAPWLQWTLFAAIAVVLLLVLREKISSILSRGKGSSVDSLVGQVVTLRSDIAPGASGSVSLRGSSWTAHNVGSQTLAAKSQAYVVEVDGINLRIDSQKKQ